MKDRKKYLTASILSFLSTIIWIINAVVSSFPRYGAPENLAITPSICATLSFIATIAFFIAYIKCKHTHEE